MKALDYSNCPRKCLWPRYHADLLKMESQQRFTCSEVKYTNIGMVRQTRLHSMDTQVSAADEIGKMKEGLSTSTGRLHNNLVIYDLKSLLEKLYQKESAMVRLEETETFLNAVTNITGSFATIFKGDLINDYRMFVANL